MKNLDQWNSEQGQAYRYLTDPHPNGIACSRCGAELMDSNPGETLTSNPPQKSVHCPKCNFTGYRIA